MGLSSLQQLIELLHLKLVQGSVGCHDTESTHDEKSEATLVTTICLMLYTDKTNQEVSALKLKILQAWKGDRPSHCLTRQTCDTKTQGYIRFIREMLTGSQNNLLPVSKNPNGLITSLTAFQNYHNILREQQDVVNLLCSWVLWLQMFHWH